MDAILKQIGRTAFVWTACLHGRQDAQQLGTISSMLYATFALLLYLFPCRFWDVSVILLGLIHFWPHTPWLVPLLWYSPDSRYVGYVYFTLVHGAPSIQDCKSPLWIVLASTTSLLSIVYAAEEQIDRIVVAVAVPHLALWSWPYLRRSLSRSGSSKAVLTLCTDVKASKNPPGNWNWSLT